MLSDTLLTTSGVESVLMKNIISWNVNGLRAIHRKGQFKEIYVDFLNKPINNNLLLVGIYKKSIIDA